MIASNGERATPGPPRDAAGLELDLGFGTIAFESGTLYPMAAAAEGRALEVVFLGNATFSVEPPDAIEAGQLRRFTGSDALDEPIGAGVLVVCGERARAVTGQPEASAHSPGTPGTSSDVAMGDGRDLARAKFAAWRDGVERRVLGVDRALGALERGDRILDGYFAGRLESERLGPFLVNADPTRAEQGSIGQFVQPDLTEREERKVRRARHKRLKHGWVGIEVEDLGVYEQWFSSSRRNVGGEPRPGHVGFEARHYDLEVSIDAEVKTIEGIARVRVQAVGSGRATVPLHMMSGLEASRVVLDGAELPFDQNVAVGAALREIDVWLPEPSVDGSELELEVHFGGPAIERVSDGFTGGYAIVDTQRWYPQLPTIGFATYDMSFEWPSTYDVRATGKRSREKRKGLRESARFVIDRPTIGASFEIGRFKTVKRKVGDVTILVSFDDNAADIDEEVEESVLDRVEGVLTYFQAKLGPYPLSTLEVVTTRRWFSQGLLGFVTLGIPVVLVPEGSIVIAHEIAHQWWGHAVAFASYRDQWLSEAMSEYSARLYVRERVPENQRGEALYPYWRRAVSWPTGTGAPYDSVGPIVLGGRLSSTDAPYAYDILVYEKGAVVLGVLAQHFGEEMFWWLSQQVIQAADFRPIDTETYLRVMESASEQNLDWFRPYLFDTGLDVVGYRYDFTRGSNGTWKVKCTWQREPVRRYTYRVERLEDGRFDVRRDIASYGTTGRTEITAPFAIGVHDPKTMTSRMKREDPKFPNKIFTGRAPLRGKNGTFDFEVDHEPRYLELDPDAQVFADFLHVRPGGKRELVSKAYGALFGVRDPAAARERFAEAIAAEPEKDDDDDTSELLDTLAWIEIARIDLDGGNVRAAREALAEAREVSKSWLRGEREFLEARADLLDGRTADALKWLERGVKRKYARVEGYVVLAIAARAENDARTFEAAMRIARATGADVEALRPAP